MTPDQNAKYWAQWNKVRGVLTDMGGYDRKEADDMRGVIQREAIGGKTKSSKLLTNREFDHVLDAFDKYLVLVNGPGSEDRDPRKRLVFAIEQLGLDEPYLVHICVAQFKETNWRTLTEHQMIRFRYTATARAAAKKRAA